jgi:hypothetical protein
MLNFFFNEPIFKLEIDNSGGRKMKELITGPLPYYTYKKVLLKMYNWISKNGWTTEKTGIHLNLNFNEKVLGLRRNMEHLNKIKFILDFDEEYIFKRFPSRKNNVYARSIKNITVNQIFFNLHDLSSVFAQQFNAPMVKYYGMNFLKTIDNYIEVRYLGGEDYETKYKDTMAVYEHVIFALYKVLKDPSMSQKNFKDLQEIARPYIKYYRVYRNPVLIPTIMPELLVTVDLSPDFEVIKTHWPNIKDKLFHLIIAGGVRKGHFNYNSDNQKFEIKEAKIDAADVNGYTLINCKVNALVENCEFESCEVNSSIVHNSIFFEDNKVEHTKIEDCVVHRGNTFIKSYVDNHDFMFNGELISSIFRSGLKGTDMKFDNKTEIIED